MNLSKRELTLLGRIAAVVESGDYLMSEAENALHGLCAYYRKEQKNFVQHRQVSEIAKYRQQVFKEEKAASSAKNAACKKDNRSN